MERDFVEWLAENLPAHPLLKLGVGDDAAVLSLGHAADAVVTTDLLADGTHFLTDEVEPDLIGRKCLAANLSDLAAMAAEPVAAVVSLLLPRDGAGRHGAAELARRLLRGMLPMADEFDCAIAGGDTNVWPGRLAVSITAIGRTTARGPLLRSGAQVGDRLLVTGTLGGSLEGQHLAFTPRVREALRLHRDYELHAAMDITDGLAIDLHRMTAASGVGCLLVGADVPASPDAERLALAAGVDPLTHTLGDGEDFELLLAAPPDAAKQLCERQPVDCGVTDIGEVIAQGVWLREVSGETAPLPPRGYQHS